MRTKKNDEIYSLAFQIYRLAFLVSLLIVTDINILSYKYLWTTHIYNDTIIAVEMSEPIIEGESLKHIYTIDERYAESMCTILIIF